MGCDVEGLRQWVSCSTEVRGGEPVLRGTRFPVAKILSELSQGASLEDIADDYEQDPEAISGFLCELSRAMNDADFKKILKG